MGGGGVSGLFNKNSARGIAFGTFASPNARITLRARSREVNCKTKSLINGDPSKHSEAIHTLCVAMRQQCGVLAGMPRLEFVHCPHRVCPFHDEARHLCEGFRAQLGVACSVCVCARGNERVEHVAPKAIRNVLQLLFDPKRKCRVDHNIRSFHLARCKSQQLRAHVTAAANITYFGLLMRCRSLGARLGPRKVATPTSVAFVREIGELSKPLGTTSIGMVSGSISTVGSAKGICAPRPCTVSGRKPSTTF